MKPARRRIILTAVVGTSTALALTACVTSTQTSKAYVSPFYSADVVRYVTSGGAMPLEVKGQPFAGMDGNNVTWHTAQRMELPSWFVTRKFAPAPVEGTPSGNYRTVIVFNSAELTIDSEDVCRDTAEIKVTPPGRRVNVIAAFCAGDEVVTDTYGSTTASGPDAAEYRQLMTQISMTLFPLRNIETENGPDIPPNN
jgi:hypothetical protein